MSPHFSSRAECPLYTNRWKDLMAHGKNFLSKKKRLFLLLAPLHHLLLLFLRLQSLHHHSSAHNSCISVFLPLSHFPTWDEISLDRLVPMLSRLTQLTGRQSRVGSKGIFSSAAHRSRGIYSAHLLRSSPQFWASPNQYWVPYEFTTPFELVW